MLSIAASESDYSIYCIQGFFTVQQVSAPERDWGTSVSPMALALDFSLRALMAEKFRSRMNDGSTQGTNMLGRGDQ